MSGHIEVQKIDNEADMATAHAIRKMVFVDEQHCPPELEWENDDKATHFLALMDGVPCGAARWRAAANGYKLERFAVLAAFRNKGVGSSLVQKVLADLPSDSALRYLNAQVEAVPLYLKFGFKPVGELFEEANIIHRRMER